MLNWAAFEEGGSIATRSSSHKVLSAIAKRIPILSVVRLTLLGPIKRN